MKNEYGTFVVKEYKSGDNLNDPDLYNKPEFYKEIHGLENRRQDMKLRQISQLISQQEKTR